MPNFFMCPTDTVNRTRLRDAHDTYGNIISTWTPSDLVECSEEWVAPVDKFTPAGVKYQHKGDRWGLVVEINNAEVFPGLYMAIVDKGIEICRIVDSPVPPVPFEWPETAEIKLGNGEAALYGFLHRIN